MRHLHTWMACGVLWASVGCTDTPDAPSMDGVAARMATTFTSWTSPVVARFYGASPTVNVDTPLTPIDGEYEDRILTIVPASTVPCPSPNVNWTMRRLFETANATPIPPALGRYCLFTWSGVGPPVLPAFQTGSLEANPDHAVVMPASTPSLTEITQPGYQLEYAHAVGNAPMHGMATSTLPRIAVLDTSPDSSETVGGWETVGLNDHGYALANMIRNIQTVPVMDDLGIITTESVAQVTTRLTMDLYIDPASGEVVRDEVGGGDFGTVAILAEAIHAEVDDWMVRGDDEPLIINLSLGWNPLYGGTDPLPSNWTYDVQAVFDALYEASCRGAVVVASSGNRSGGPSGNAGPVYPAAWATEFIQDVECASRLGGVAADFSDVDEAPLIYAVGGVDEDGVDLAVSRVNSRPRFVAYGDHATDFDANGDYTSILTGTSVSAAVVSASLAVAWHNIPSQLGYTLMAAIYDSGTTTSPIAPAFCPGGGCGDARQIDVCNAVREVCSTPTLGSCARAILPITCAPGPAPDGSPDPADLADFVAATPSFTLDFPYAARSAAACASGAFELYAETPWRAADPCPEQQYYDARMEPWTNPQPKHDTCPPCYIDTGSGIVYIEMDGGLSDYDSLSIYAKFTSGRVGSFTTVELPPTDSVIFEFDPSYLVGAEQGWITATGSSTSYTAEVELR